jgi:hypothetical protein
LSGASMIDRHIGVGYIDAINAGDIDGWPPC